MVIEVQVPSAARRKSYGDGPVSVPPKATGSSPLRRCDPISISWANPAAPPRTIIRGGTLEVFSAIVENNNETLFTSHPSLLLRFPRIVSRIYIFNFKRPGAVNLHNRFTGGPCEMLHTGRHYGKTARNHFVAGAFVEFVTRAKVECSRDDSNVFCRGMRM